MIWRQKNSKKAFTIIEMMTVLACLVAIGTMSLVYFNYTKAKSRDIKRISDLENIQGFLYLYYADKGYYPGTHNAWYDASTNCAVECDAARPGELCPELSDFMVPAYLDAMPSDPRCNSTYYYAFQPISHTGTTGDGYKLIFLPETDWAGNQPGNLHCYDSSDPNYYCTGVNFIY